MVSGTELSFLTTRFFLENFQFLSVNSDVSDHTPWNFPVGTSVRANSSRSTYNKPVNYYGKMVYIRYIQCVFIFRWGTCTKKIRDRYFHFFLPKVVKIFYLNIVVVYFGIYIYIRNYVLPLSLLTVKRNTRHVLFEPERKLKLIVRFETKIND